MCAPALIMTIMHHDEIISKFNEIFGDPYNKARWKTDAGKLLRTELINSNFFNFESIDQKVWSLRNKNYTRPICCVCSKPASFRQGKFIPTCGSPSCAKLNPIAKNKVAKTNLLRYGSVCPLQNKVVQQKSIDTSIRNYGVRHPMQNADFVKLNQEAFAKKNGVDNAFKLQSCIDKSRILAQSDEAKAKRVASITKTKADLKFKRKLFEKYEKTKLPARLASIKQKQNIVAIFDKWEGKFKLYPWKHETCGHYFLAKIAHADSFMCPRCKPRSIPQEKVLLMCEDLGITVLENDRTQIKPREIDLWLPQEQIGIEINGVYWHHDLTTGLPLLEKSKLLKTGTLLHFWDFEIHQSPDIIKSMIAVRTGRAKVKISAKQCKIVEICKLTANSFFQINHINGQCDADRYFALEKNNEVLYVGAFNIDVDITNMIRCASKLNCVIIGGLSKLSKFVVTKFKSTLFTHVDIRFAHGNSYESAGFVLCETMPPVIQYFNGSVDEKPRNIKDIDAQLILKNYDFTVSKEDNLLANGWLKIKDCGHYKYFFPNLS